MTKLYCVKNNSKTLPFTEWKPYTGEYQGDGYYKIYGDGMTHIMAPVMGSLVEFIIVE